MQYGVAIERTNDGTADFPAAISIYQARGLNIVTTLHHATVLKGR
jgi:hypothetical protein